MDWIVHFTSKFTISIIDKYIQEDKAHNKYSYTIRFILVKICYVTNKCIYFLDVDRYVGRQSTIRPFLHATSTPSATTRSSTTSSTTSKYPVYQPGDCSSNPCKVAFSKQEHIFHEGEETILEKRSKKEISRYIIGKRIEMDI